MVMTSIYLTVVISFKTMVVSFKTMVLFITINVMELDVFFPRVLR